MRRPLLSLALLAAVSIAGCGTPGAQVRTGGASATPPSTSSSTTTTLPMTGAPSPYQRTELPNGLDVIVIEDHSLPIATIDVTVNTGAFTEPDEYAGLSHLYEHMFFKANRVYPSQEAYMKRVRELGIVYNGYTSQEVVTYYFTLPSKNIEPGMDFMAAAIKTPAFVQEELLREREVVLGEFDRNEASPEFALRYALDSALWMPHVSRKQPLGQRPVIQSATVDKMNFIRERYYVPNNAALIVSGDVEAGQVFKLAQQYFADWKRGADPFPQYLPPAFTSLKPQVVAREARIPDVLLRVRFFGPSVGKDDADVHVSQLFSTLISQPTSRFYHNLVDSGLATQVNAWAENSRFTGTINFTLRTSPELSRRAIDALKREIAAMASPGYFSDEEVRIGKQIIADRSKFERNNIHDFTIQTTARWWAMAGLDYYEGFPAAVAAINPQQLTAFAQKYMVGRPFVLGVGAQRETLSRLNITDEVLRW
jgi:zinc protease